MGYPHCQGWANPRWGTGATLPSGQSLAAHSSSCGTDAFQSASAVAFFFFSQSCDVTLIFMLCCSPQSTENSKRSLSSWQALHLQQQHLCSEPGFLFAHPSEPESSPPTPPFVHLHSPKHTLNVFSRKSPLLSEKAQVIQPLM